MAADLLGVMRGRLEVVDEGRRMDARVVLMMDVMLMEL